ncbi:MAG: hypothetical protein RL367_2253 [Pseudomonadota bacterium]
MNEDLAKGRFMKLNLARLFALALVMAGAANLAGKFLADMAPILGSLLLVVGAADFFLLPIILKKVWSRQDRL